MFSFLKYIECLLSFSPLLSYFELQSTNYDRVKVYNRKRSLIGPFSKHQYSHQILPQHHNSNKTAFPPPAAGRSGSPDGCCSSTIIWSEELCTSFLHLWYLSWSWLHKVHLGKAVSSSWLRTELLKGEKS